VRRAREHEIARLDGHHPRGEADHLAAVDDHVVRVPVLSLLTVDPAFEPQVVRVADQVAGYEVWPEGREAVEGLADQELAGQVLHVAGGEVVAGAVTG